MTKSGKSLYYFGIYALVTGLLIILIPDILISGMQFPSLPNCWARVIGLLVLVIGTYDILCGRNNIGPFIKASVYVRLGFTLSTIILVAAGQMPWTLILLGGIDALGALWTAMALKSEVITYNGQ